MVDPHTLVPARIDVEEINRIAAEEAAEEAREDQRKDDEYAAKMAANMNVNSRQGSKERVQNAVHKVVVPKKEPALGTAIAGIKSKPEHELFEEEDDDECGRCGPRWRSYNSNKRS